MIRRILTALRASLTDARNLWRQTEGADLMEDLPHVLRDMQARQRREAESRAEFDGWLP